MYNETITPKENSIMSYNDDYAIYLRKSRKDLEMEKYGEGETLAKHERILTEFAKDKKLRIRKIYREIVSGDSIADRPVMQELLRDIHKRLYKGVLVVELERLARGDVKDQGTVSEAFKYTNTLIVTPNKTYDPHDELDEEFFEFGLFMSRREYKTIKRRLMTARQKVVEDGNWIGTIAPYGYDQKRLDRKTKILIPNEESNIVKLMFKWFVEDNVSYGEIGRRLTAMGVPTRTGKNPEWNRATIKEILKNDVYRGKIRWKHRQIVKEFEDGEIVKVTKRFERDECILVDGKHEALVDDDTFFKAQEIFGTLARTPIKKETSNILAGLIRCSACGRMMQRQGRKNLGQPRLIHAFGTQCKMGSTFFNDVVDAIINQLKKELGDYEEVLQSDDMEDQLNDYEMLKEEYENEIARLKKNRLNAFDKLDRNIFTEEEFMEYKEMINSQISAVEEQLRRLKKPEKSEMEERAYTLYKVIESLKDERIPAKERNLLLKSIIRNIDYTKLDDVVTLDITYV